MESKSRPYEKFDEILEIDDLTKSYRPSFDAPSQVYFPHFKSDIKSLGPESGSDQASKKTISMLFDEERNTDYTLYPYLFPPLLSVLFLNSSSSKLFLQIVFSSYSTFFIFNMDEIV